MKNLLFYLSFVLVLNSSFILANSGLNLFFQETIYEVYEEATKSWSVQDLESPPTPIGGEENFWNIVNSQIAYPDRAQRMKISGEVILTMTIDKRGQLSYLEVKKGLEGGCSEEAFNAIRVASTNRFTPAILNGKAVKARYDVSINFSYR